jgi:hypothetical protein
MIILLKLGNGNTFALNMDNVSTVEFEAQGGAIVTFNWGVEDEHGNPQPDRMVLSREPAIALYRALAPRTPAPEPPPPPAGGRPR